MASDRGGDVSRDLRTLFGAGVVGSLSDGELLGRFHAREDDSAELAFAALLDRHGPMVLRVCRSVLRDEHDAQDALQATFLVLARRAGSIRRRDSVGSWLYGVALRVASSARAAEARRRAARAWGGRTIDGGRVDWDRAGCGRDPPRGARPAAGALSRGIGALSPGGPGLRGGGASAGVADRHGQEPAGAGRERLRDRLTRRGLAPSVAAGGVLAAESSRAAVPLADTIRAVLSSMNPNTAGGGMVSPGARALARKVVIAMFLGKIRTAAAVVMACGGLSAGVMLVHQRLAEGAMPEPQPEPRPAPAAKTPENTDEGPTRFRRVGLDPDDVVNVTGLDLYKYRLDDMPKGKRFRVMIREQKDAKTPPRVLYDLPFKKTAEGPATFRFSFLRRDRTLQGVLLSQEEQAEFRVNATGCDPSGFVTIVEVPLHGVEPTRKGLIPHRSDEAIRRSGIKETRLLTIVASEPGKPGSSPTAFPRGELVIVDDPEPKSSTD